MYSCSHTDTPLFFPFIFSVSGAAPLSYSQSNSFSLCTKISTKYLSAFSASLKLCPDLCAFSFIVSLQTCCYYIFTALLSTLIYIHIYTHTKKLSFRLDQYFHTNSYLQSNVILTSLSCTLFFSQARLEECQEAEGF